MTVSADAARMEGRMPDMGATAGGLVSAGAQLLQIRTEKQLLVAVQRPRDEERFAVKLHAEASAAGEDFFYSIPYKDHLPNCGDRRNCSCPKTFVEGPGVGLARSAARLWGNCNIDVTIEQDTPDAWLVGAWFIDFETNYTRHDTKRISKMKALKGGKMVRAADRDLDVVYQQGASKVERDVILRALPRHVIDRAFELAKFAAIQDKLPVRDQLARLLRRFNEIDVTASQLERYLGHAFNEETILKAEKDPREVIAHLRGVITAIKGGEREAHEFFGEGAGEAAVVVPPSAAGPAAVNLADLKPVPEGTAAAVGRSPGFKSVEEEFRAQAEVMGFKVDAKKPMERLLEQLGQPAKAMTPDLWARALAELRRRHAEKLAQAAGNGPPVTTPDATGEVAMTLLERVVAVLTECRAAAADPGREFVVAWPADTQNMWLCDVPLLLAAKLPTNQSCELAKLSDEALGRVFLEAEDLRKRLLEARA